MTPKCGWVSKPNSLITRLILGKNSVFCSWSKKYMYEAKIVENRKIKEENDQSIREMDSFIEEYSSTFRR